MIREINHPNIEPIGKRLYRLEEDYEFLISWKGRVYTFKIKKGFEYDGASIPRWLWSITGLTPDGLLRAAALIHDIMYVYKGILDDTCKYVEVYHKGQRVDLKFTRKESDKIFRRVAKDSGVSKFNQWLVYTGVQVGGKEYWKKPRTHE